MSAPPWKEGTFYDNLNAAVDVLGVENVGIAWGIAQAPWRNVAERDRFLSLLTATPVEEGPTDAVAAV